jgi:hypothetical protein
MEVSMRRSVVFVALTLVALVAALTWGRLAEGKDDPKLRPTRDEVHQMVFFAVLEGLYEDGASNAFVDRVLAIDPATEQPQHFVPGCPLCGPAQDAFRAYRARPKFYGVKDDTDTFGHGVSETWKKGIADASQKRRLDTLMQMVQSYTRRRLDKFRLNEKVRSRWIRDLKERAKKGTTIMRVWQEGKQAGAFSGMKSCGVCEGAAGVFDR